MTIPQSNKPHGHAWDLFDEYERWFADSVYSKMSPIGPSVRDVAIEFARHLQEKQAVPGKEGDAHE